jgi:hypothetical protein
VEIDVPRDRDGTFEPAIVRKRQRRPDGIEVIETFRQRWQQGLDELAPDLRYPAIIDCGARRGGTSSRSSTTTSNQKSCAARTPSRAWKDRSPRS